LDVEYLHMMIISVTDKRTCR